MTTISADATLQQNGPYSHLTLGELVMAMYERYEAARTTGTLSATPCWKRRDSRSGVKTQVAPVVHAP